MDKRLKAKWLKALRSGEYAQGRHCLVTTGKRYDKFCCLGVLADVMGYEFDIQGGHESQADQDALYPIVFDEMLGRNTRADLTTMNDAGDDFENIANWIERNL